MAQPAGKKGDGGLGILLALRPRDGETKKDDSAKPPKGFTAASKALMQAMKEGDSGAFEDALKSAIRLAEE